MDQMMSKIPQKCLTDTGFWIGYFDEKDQHHNDSVELSDIIFDSTIIFPFPSLYEFLNTRFSRSPKRINHLEQIIKKINIEYIYDDAYRKNMVDNYINRNKISSHLSSVDIIIGSILEDINIKVDYLVTFNSSDFYTICSKRNIEILGV